MTRWHPNGNRTLHVSNDYGVLKGTSNYRRELNMHVAHSIPQYPKRIEKVVDGEALPSGDTE